MGDEFWVMSNEISLTHHPNRA